jgi:hypothetical protein
MRSRTANPKIRVRRNGEKISWFSHRLPPSFHFIASKSDAEKVAYIRAVLARSEEEALAVIKPVFKLIRTAVEVFDVYRPIIIVLRDHFSRPGRPKPGQITWAQICEQYIGVGIRRTQQLLVASTPASKSSTPPKLRKGDCIALLRTTDCDLSKVFGPITGANEFAEVLREYAQGLANRFGERHAKFVVSVSIQNRRGKTVHAGGRSSVASLRAGNNAGDGKPSPLPILSNQKSFPQVCSGCADMHFGIAQYLQRTGGGDEEAAEACGVSLAVIRQARVRHTLLLGDAVREPSA